IEGIIGDGVGPELLMVSHYDTVPKSPGANDNGSGVSVMLEAARVFAESDYTGNLRFVSFSLEEGNPARSLRIRQLAQSTRIRDADCRFSSWRAVKTIRKFSNIMVKLTFDNEAYVAATEALRQVKEYLTESEFEYFQGLTEVYKGVSKTSWPGQISLMGSSHWVDEAVRSGKEILGVICMDPVGYFSKRGNTQTWPGGMGPETFKIHGTSEGLDVGDFIVIIGDKNSQPLSKTFCDQCRRKTIDLPSACLQEDFSFVQAAHVMHDILRSDHAPFWRADIPAILLTDTANYRYPHYHSPADTIDKLDFDYMTKICKGVIATAIKLTT
ncbi:MAG: M28 family peptidase, partial [Candidatus Thorarchaeota archaeon]